MDTEKLIDEIEYIKSLIVACRLLTNTHSEAYEILCDLVSRCDNILTDYRIEIRIKNS